jgi:hypothetical protein
MNLGVGIATSLFMFGSNYYEIGGTDWASSHQEEPRAAGGIRSPHFAGDLFADRGFRRWEVRP